MLHDLPVRRLLEGGAYFESPRWHDGSWYVSDVYAGQVLAVRPDGSSTVLLEQDGPVSGLGWLPDGDLLAVSMQDQRVLRVGLGGAVTVHADLSKWAVGELNDMVVGPDGNAYVGYVGFDLIGGEPPRPAGLVVVRPDGSAEPAADGLMFPNGAALTADGTVLVVGETFGGKYTAFDVAPNGGLSRPRPWAPLPAGVLPDGCALDPAGGMWSADAGTGRVLRVLEGGDVTDEIPPPDGLRSFAVALGGPSGRTLLLCAAPDFVPAARLADRQGTLLTVDLARNPT